MSPGPRQVRLARGSCLVLALIGLLVGIVVPGAALASSSNGHVLVDLGNGFTSSPRGTLISMTGLAPGLTTSGSMGVRNAYDSSSDLYLKFTDVTDQDGACAHPGQSGCGGRHGQLGAELVFTVAVADTATDAYQPVWSGSAAQLEQGVAIIKSMPASTARWVRLSATLPESSGNETQSDRLGFGLQVILQSGSGVDAVSVETSYGVDAASVGPSSGGSGALAVTGASIVLLGVVAILLTVCGWVLLLSVRRRPRHGSAWTAPAEWIGARRSTLGRHSPLPHVDRSGSVVSLPHLKRSV